MINIELKVKHYYLIADILFQQAAYASFSILEKVKTACSGKTEDDLTTVEIDVPSFIDVFVVLTQKPEGAFNMINTEMMDLLTPQIQAGVNSGDPEWIDLATQVQQIRENNWSIPVSMIASGKSKLGL